MVLLSSASLLLLSSEFPAVSLLLWLWGGQHTTPRAHITALSEHIVNSSLVLGMSIAFSELNSALSIRLAPILLRAAVDLQTNILCIVLLSFPLILLTTVLFRKIHI